MICSSNFQISQQAFNGSSLFASTVDRTASAAVLFKSTTNSQDHTIDIFTSDNGSEGTKISINRSALLSALTIDNQADAVTGNFDSAVYQGATAGNATANANAKATATITFASEDSTTVLNLESVSMQVFEQALSNIAFLRAEAGGSMSGYNLLPSRSLPTRQICVRLLAELRMWISPRRVPTWPSIQS